MVRTLHSSLHLHGYLFKCVSRTDLAAILWVWGCVGEGINTPKSLLLDTYPFVCARLPGEVGCGKAPVVFKSLFLINNVPQHYLLRHYTHFASPILSLLHSWKIQIFFFCSLGVRSELVMGECTMSKNLKNPNSSQERSQGHVHVMHFNIFHPDFLFTMLG